MLSVSIANSISHFQYWLVISLTFLLLILIWFDRFRHGYCRHNPRKMVRTWAEKEMRNLRRLHRAGIPCPEPIFHRGHVIVMGFIGSDGR